MALVVSRYAKATFPCASALSCGADSADGAPAALASYGFSVMGVRQALLAPSNSATVMRSVGPDSSAHAASPFPLGRPTVSVGSPLKVWGTANPRFSSPEVGVPPSMVAPMSPKNAEVSSRCHAIHGVVPPSVLADRLRWIRSTLLLVSACDGVQLGAAAAGAAGAAIAMAASTAARGEKRGPTVMSATVSNRISDPRPEKRPRGCRTLVRHPRCEAVMAGST